jgi:phosphoglycerate dehydrogenase-like enzyme
MRVLVHYDQPELFVDLLTERFAQATVECCRSYAALGEAVGRFRPEVLFAIKFENQAYPREAVLETPSLRWVSVGGVGVDHLHPWDPEKLTVTNGAGVASDVMADYVVGGAIALAMRFPQFMHKQRRHRWEWEYVEPLAGKTLAVIGLGHVGQAVARRAAALGLRVVGTRARPRPTEFVDRVYGPDGLHAVLAEGDFVAVTSPLLDETRHMIGPAAFEAMKEGAYIVDVSRGGVVDSAALLGALERGKLAGAVLDVFETEPMPADSPIWDRPDVLVTPHNCAVFRGWERKTFGWFCDNLEHYLAGEPLANVVDPLRGY